MATKKPARKKPTPAARKARQRTRDAATRPTAPRDLLAVIADQARALTAQIALIALLQRPAADTVLRRIVLQLLDLLATATLDHGEAQLRDLLAEAHAALDADGTRSNTVAADVAVRAIAERDQFKSELDDVREELAIRVAMSGPDGPERFAQELHTLKTEHAAERDATLRIVQATRTERDAARDTLAGIAEQAGLQNWQTATPEGLRAILDAVRDLRRGHNECLEDLQCVEKIAKTYESALQRAATLVGAEGKYGDMDAGRAELVVDLIKALKAERAEAVTAKRTADELLTHATAENAELRRRLAALDTPAAPVASEVS